MTIDSPEPLPYLPIFLRYEIFTKISYPIFPRVKRRDKNEKNGFRAGNFIRLTRCGDLETGRIDVCSSGAGIGERDFKQTSSSLARGCIGCTRSRVNTTDRVEPLETSNEGLVVFLSRLGSPFKTGSSGF